MQLQKATRKKSKLRLNLSGPAGSGKTYSALLMAYGLTNNWEKIGVIDTENGSASLYSHLGPFMTIDLQAPYSPERYIEAIDACINGGMEVVIIDSSTHEWAGAGGCLEANEKLAGARFKGNTWAAWNETTPRHDRFVNKVLQSPIHFITCTRSKTETVQEGNKIKKLGMKDIQRDSWEYELTVSLSIDRDSHLASASKDRTNLFEGLDPFLISAETGKKIKDWCESGAEPAPEINPVSAAIAEMYLATTLDSMKAVWSKYKQYQTDAKFTAAKDEMKSKLSKPTKEIAHESKIEQPEGPLRD